MKYCVYFHHGFNSSELLKEFDSLETAEKYRLEQLEIEGWEDEVGTESDKYEVILEFDLD